MPYYNVEITTQYTTENGKQKQSIIDADLITGINSPFEFFCHRLLTPVFYRAQSFDFTIKLYGSTHHMVSRDVIPQEDAEEYERSYDRSNHSTTSWTKAETDNRIASKAENHLACFTRTVGNHTEEGCEVLLRDSLPSPFHDFLNEQFIYEILQQAQYFRFILVVDGSVYELETITPADDAPAVCPY